MNPNPETNCMQSMTATPTLSRPRHPHTPSFRLCNFRESGFGFAGFAFRDSRESKPSEPDSPPLPPPTDTQTQDRPINARAPPEPPRRSDRRISGFGFPVSGFRSRLTYPSFPAEIGPIDAGVSTEPARGGNLRVSGSRFRVSNFGFRVQVLDSPCFLSHRYANARPANRC